MRRRGRQEWQRAAGAAPVQLVLWGSTALTLYPILVMLFSGFRTTAEIFDNPFAPPLHGTLDNYATLFGDNTFLLWFANSAIVTLGSAALTLTLGTMAAYALARYEFRGATLLYLLFLAGLMLPLKLAVIPLFMELRDVGLLDTRLGLILIYTAAGIPSAVFILTGFLRTLPAELEQAARIDGASEPRIMWSVMLPLTRPALVIAGINNAIPTWNDFFFPLVFIQSDARKTLPQGLTAFIGEYTTDWGMLFAGLTLAAVPIALVYIVLSRQFIAGMTAGSVK
jgi:raffinose/stachyose/melibiose transport system permease protein